MKRFLALTLCFIFIFLCSCANNSGASNTTSVQPASTTKNASQNTAPAETSLTTQTEIATVRIETTPDDPYSHFIKDWYEEIYEAQKSEGAEYFAEFDKHALDVFYFIYDIDRNGVDELVLGDWKRITNDLEDYNAPKKIVISSVYTIENDEVVKQNVHPWWNDEYLWDRVILTNGLIRTSTGYEEYPSYSYLGFENGKLELKYAIYCMDDGYGKKKYLCLYADNIEAQEEITKEEFERLRDEANGDSEIVEIKWKRIDEYGK